MTNLKNKTAIVTGGSRGIGKAIALELAVQGADVAILYYGSEAAALETCAQLEQLAVKAKAYRCDVASFDATKDTVKEIISFFGKVDILVNNAGITKDGLLLSMSEASFDEVINANLKGAFNMIRHIYSPMMKQRSGRIINISSVAGIMGNAGQANYASAKAGMIGLTKTVARELAGRNVTCNAVAPGFIESDMTAKLPDKVKEGALASIPLKRMGQPGEIAKAVAFLASEDASYITGAVIQIDGGLCM